MAVPLVGLPPYLLLGTEDELHASTVSKHGTYIRAFSVNKVNQYFCIYNPEWAVKYFLSVIQEQPSVLSTTTVQMFIEHCHPYLQSVLFYR